MAPLLSSSPSAAAAALAPSTSTGGSRSTSSLATARSSSAPCSSSLPSPSSRAFASSSSPSGLARSIGIGRKARRSVGSLRTPTIAMASTSDPPSNSPQVATPGRTKVAFLGMGIMGVAMASNLVKAGYEVVVWNRNASACDPLVALGAERAETAAEAASRADVVVAMVSDPSAAVAVAEAAAPGLTSSKGYIDASTVDAGTARRVSEIVSEKGATFLEAPVSGSKAPAVAGQLIFLTSGDSSLSAFAAPLLDVMGKKTFFLGEEVGLGAKMKLAVNALMGTMMASLGEQLALAAASGLEPKDLLDVVALGAVAAPMFSLKGPAMAEAVSDARAKKKGDAARFPPAFPLKHQRKDLRLALELASECGAGPLPLTRAACEAFAEAQDSRGLGDLDFAAVVEAVAAKME